MLRSILILVSVSMCGCAADGDPDPVPVLVANEPPQRPAPVEDHSKTPGPACHITRSVSGGNCRIDVYECDDGSVKLDGKCYPGWTPPWKNLPDPPPFAQ